jgi:hypothetical protein
MRTTVCAIPICGPSASKPKTAHEEEISSFPPIAASQLQSFTLVSSHSIRGAALKRACFTALE